MNDILIEGSGLDGNTVSTIKIIIVGWILITIYACLQTSLLRILKDKKQLKVINRVVKYLFIVTYPIIILDTLTRKPSLFEEGEE